MTERATRLPFVGARYERNCPTRYPAPIEGLPVRVTVLDNRASHFGCHGVLVSMPWDFPWKPPEWRTTDEVKLNLEQFLEQYHAIDNVVMLHAVGEEARPKEE
jgi:hypothetical protein